MAKVMTVNEPEKKEKEQSGMRGLQSSLHISRNCG